MRTVLVVLHYVCSSVRPLYRVWHRHDLWLCWIMSFFQIIIGSCPGPVSMLQSAKLIQLGLKRKKSHYITWIDNLFNCMIELWKKRREIKEWKLTSCGTWFEMRRWWSAGAAGRWRCGDRRLKRTATSGEIDCWDFSEFCVIVVFYYWTTMASFHQFLFTFFLSFS